MAGRAATAPLIGRTTELEALRAAYGQAAGGQMGAALIAGDAGVGKSRLAGELAAATPEGEAFVLVGHCLDLGEHEIPEPRWRRGCASRFPSTVAIRTTCSSSRHATSWRPACASTTRASSATCPDRATPSVPSRTR